MKPYVAFPAWRYRRGAKGFLESMLVNNEQEDQALGAGWTDTPSGLNVVEPPKPVVPPPVLRRRRGRPPKVTG